MAGFRGDIEDLTWHLEVGGIVWNVRARDDEVRMLAEGDVGGIDLLTHAVRFLHQMRGFKWSVELVRLPQGFLPMPAERMPNTPSEERDRWDRARDAFARMEATLTSIDERLGALGKLDKLDKLDRLDDMAEQATLEAILAELRR